MIYIIEDSCCHYIESVESCVSDDDAKSGVTRGIGCFYVTFSNKDVELSQC